MKKKHTPEEYGQIGGKALLKKKGRKYFSKLAKARWAKKK